MKRRSCPTACVRSAGPTTCWCWSTRPRPTERARWLDRQAHGRPSGPSTRLPLSERRRSSSPARSGCCSSTPTNASRPRSATRFAPRSPRPARAWASGFPDAMCCSGVSCVTPAGRRTTRRVCPRGGPAQPGGGRGPQKAPRLDGPAGYLREPLVHLNYRTLHEFVRKQERYSHLDAQRWLAAYGRPRLRALAGQPAREFWRRYVALRGYREGVVGLVLSLLLAWYAGKTVWLAWRTTARRGTRRATRTLS